MLLKKGTEKKRIEKNETVIFPNSFFRGMTGIRLREKRRRRRKEDGNAASCQKKRKKGSRVRSQTEHFYNFRTTKSVDKTNFPVLVQKRRSTVFEALKVRNVGSEQLKKGDGKRESQHDDKNKKGEV